MLLESPSSCLKVNPYQAGRDNQFEIGQIDPDTGMELCRGLLFSVKQHGDDTKIQKIKHILDHYYIDSKPFPKSEEFSKIVKKLEEVVGYSMEEPSMEMFLLNVHLYPIEVINEKKDAVVEFIEQSQEKEKLVILLEKLLKHLLSFSTHRQFTPLTETIYQACRKKEDWRLVGLFTFSDLQLLPESIKHDIIDVEDEDIKKFVETKDQFFYTKYPLDLNTLSRLAKGIAIDQERNVITLDDISDAFGYLSLDDAIDNPKLRLFIDHLFRNNRSKDLLMLNKYYALALETDKISFSGEVRAFRALFSEYLENTKTKIFTFEPTNFLLENKDEHKELLATIYNDYAQQLYQYKSYEQALNYFQKVLESDNEKMVFQLLLSAAKTSHWDDKMEQLYTQHKEYIATQCEEIDKLKEDGDSKTFQTYFVHLCQEQHKEQAIEEGKYILLVLIAKYLALKEEASLITKHHLEQATRYVSLQSNARKIFTEFTMLEEQEKEMLDPSVIIQARDAQKIGYDEDLKKVLAAFKTDPSAKYVVLFDGEGETSNQEEVVPSVVEETIQEDESHDASSSLVARDLLLLAKSFAINGQDEMITLEHLHRAIMSIDLDSVELANLLPKGLDIESGVMVSQAIESAQASGKIGFDSDLKQSQIYHWIKNNMDTSVGVVR
jgi:tetratricopeptide (TPR) repeat protein